MIIDSVKSLAAASFQGLGARGFGRIDVKMDDYGLCYFMEANLVPGMIMIQVTFQEPVKLPIRYLMIKSSG